MSFSVQNSFDYLNNKINSLIPVSFKYNVNDVVDTNGYMNYSAIFNIDNSSSPVIWDLDVNTSKSKIGDILNIIALPTNPGGLNLITVNLSSNFYLTKCGSPNSTVDITLLERTVTPFTFDGTKYVCTIDNC